MVRVMSRVDTRGRREVASGGEGERAHGLLVDLREQLPPDPRLGSCPQRRAVVAGEQAGDEGAEGEGHSLP